MPLLLKRNTIRFFQGSIESYKLALFSPAMPREQNDSISESLYAPTIGLIGTAAELAMSGCLVQVNGEDFLKKSDRRYKTAREILSDFRKMLRDPVPALNFITDGIEDKEGHRIILQERTTGFGTLFSQRAEGLHIGSGPNRQVCLSIAKDLKEFILTLGKSVRIHPYIQNIPIFDFEIQEVNVLLEDLIGDLNSTQTFDAKARVIKSIFLVLPELPEEGPDWIEALDRVAVDPKGEDIALLIKTIKTAVPAYLKKVSGDGNAIPMRISSGSAKALPTEIIQLKKSFTKLPDQWAAQVGTANGALNDSMLNLPAPEFVLKVFALGIDYLMKEMNVEHFSAHDVWPFVASSLSKPGTPGPYWFLIRKCNDLPQLRALTNKARKVGNKGYLNSNIQEFLDGVDVLISGRGQLTKFQELQKEIRDRSDLRNKIQNAVERWKNDEKKKLSSKYATQMISASEGNEPIGAILQEALKSGLGLKDTEATNYWIAQLCRAASEMEDVQSLCGVLLSDKSDSAKTPARKAIRLIDWKKYGPPIGD